ncbi:hypothetical protein NQZ68_004056 [Dissostichus eleginoides]|nr:hypothetical protein NQZ68_004056 [Dissostichus eleginoides]
MSPNHLGGVKDMNPYWSPTLEHCQLLFIGTKLEVQLLGTKPWSLHGLFWSWAIQDIPPSEASLFDLGPEMREWLHDTELDL